MFHYDRGLRLSGADLAVDMRRRQPRGFISHAHADHMAAHQLAFCTPATARLYRHRLGDRPTVEMPYREPLQAGDLRLTTLPAGHVLGSAMLLADDGRQRLLYTGDFKLGHSATAERAEVPQADVLVMECTFGDPKYRWPPRRQVIDQLLALVRQALAEDRTPLIQAYVLGKAQEVTRLLTDGGIPVLQHPLVHAVSQIYEASGCRLGNFSLYPGNPRPGHAVIVPPRGQRAARLPGLVRKTTLAVSGWALDPGSRYRLGADHAVPLSDHADYEELLRCVELADPRVVYCTHGPASFVERLQQQGYDARLLGRCSQLKLF